MKRSLARSLLVSAALAVALPQPLLAHKLIEEGQAVAVAKSGLTVVPSRKWNRLSGSIGKNVETWTLDGPQLNDITFYGGILPGKPLVKERNKKREPLPKFTAETLLIEIPELLEGTYRPYKNVVAFQVTSIEPTKFLGHDGVAFTYEYADNDGLTRKGQARASIIADKLYMITFDAPRLHYYDKNVGDFLTLVDTASLK
ncbi:hypothetical protein LY632_12845 [Erythrobacter sp. SDW2]|uniref:hypothetical protein n=1 Tax=Erythrobacter sp. SDW2 TaxID=2907154 RepID=UPI001F28ADB8|nr:hypothetical protein [Erythrobacter sp. SDW2]UIP06562.1 hypothetical protein LY632_12845 [Erythrobacter sp. SDW2]